MLLVNSKTFNLEQTSLRSLFFRAISNLVSRSNFSPNYIFGISPYLKYGPGQRTIGLMNTLSLHQPSHDIYYAQSGMPPIYLFFFTLISFVDVDSVLIYNQNGVYRKDWSRFSSIKAFPQILAALFAKKVIFQSNFCMQQFISIYNFPYSFLHNKSIILHNVPWIPIENCLIKNTIPVDPCALGFFLQSNSITPKHINSLLSSLIAYIPSLNVVGNLSHHLPFPSSSITHKSFVDHTFDSSIDKSEHFKSLDLVLFIADSPACSNFLLELLFIGIPVFSIGRGSLCEFVYPHYKNIYCPPSIYFERPISLIVTEISAFYTSIVYSNDFKDSTLRKFLHCREDYVETHLNFSKAL